MPQTKENLTSKIATAALSYHLDNNNQNKAIAVAALSYHLNTQNSIAPAVASAALALYLDENKDNKAHIIAQIALAMFLESEPDANFPSPKPMTVPINATSWNSKILTMRQMPIRSRKF